MREGGSAIGCKQPAVAWPRIRDQIGRRAPISDAAQGTNSCAVERCRAPAASETGAVSAPSEPIAARPAGWARSRPGGDRCPAPRRPAAAPEPAVPRGCAGETPPGRPVGLPLEERAGVRVRRPQGRPSERILPGDADMRPQRRIVRTAGPRSRPGSALPPSTRSTSRRRCRDPSACFGRWLLAHVQEAALVPALLGVVAAAPVGLVVAATPAGRDRVDDGR